VDGLFNVTITASNGTTVSAVLTIAVNQPPLITNGPPPDGAVNTVYNFAYAASGYPAPTFSVTPDSLPPGLAISSAGVISGTPNAPGTYTGTVDATNEVGTDVTQDFTINITDTAPAPTDTPTMPPWALIAMALLLFSIATRLLPSLAQKP